MNIKKDKLFLILAIALALGLMTILVYLRLDKATKQEILPNDSPGQIREPAHPNKTIPQDKMPPPPDKIPGILPPALPY